MFNSLISYFKKPEPKRPTLYRPQEIWWCSIGEARGKRIEKPVLVFRKFGSDTFWALPLTSRARDNETPFYFLVSLNGKSRTTALSQMRVLRSDQLIRKLGKISTKQFGAVNASIVRSLMETDPLRGPRVPSGNTRKYGATPVKTPLRYPRVAPAIFPHAHTLRFR